MCGRTAWKVEDDKNRGARLGDGDVAMEMGTSTDWHTDVRLVTRNSLLDLAIVIYTCYCTASKMLQKLHSIHVQVLVIGS